MVCKHLSLVLGGAVCYPKFFVGLFLDVQVPFQVTGAAWGGRALPLGVGSCGQSTSGAVWEMFLLTVPSICGADQPTRTDLC